MRAERWSSLCDQFRSMKELEGHGVIDASVNEIAPRLKEILEEKRLSRASNLFARAVQQDPGDAKTYYLIAQVHFHAHYFENVMSASRLPVRSSSIR